jgi:hypothetical protein
MLARVLDGCSWVHRAEPGSQHIITAAELPMESGWVSWLGTSPLNPPAPFLSVSQDRERNCSQQAAAEPLPKMEAAVRLMGWERERWSW